MAVNQSMTRARRATSARDMSLEKKRSRRAWHARILTFIALVGLTAIFYPIGAHWLSARGQTVALVEYSSSAASPRADRVFEAAQEYNRNIWAQDPRAYAGQLRFEDTEVMARLVVPSARIDLPVYHGTAEDVLLRGAGHVAASHLPVGGEMTNAVLTAHTGLPHASMFDRLPEVELGDPVRIIVAGRALTYQITEIDVLDPKSAERRAVAAPGSDRLTLITCTPYAVNTHRLVVSAERVEDGTPFEQELPQGPGFPWWLIPYLALAVSVLFVSRRLHGCPGRARVRDGGTRPDA